MILYRVINYSCNIPKEMKNLEFFFEIIFTNDYEEYKSRKQWKHLVLHTNIKHHNHKHKTELK